MNAYCRAAALLCCVGALVRADCKVKFNDDFFTLDPKRVKSGLNYIMKTDGTSEMTYMKNFNANKDKETLDLSGHRVFGFEDIVATDYDTFILVRTCVGEQEKAHLLAAGHNYTRRIHSAISTASWRGKWSATFNKAVKDMMPFGNAYNPNTCLNLTPMKNVKSHEFDGRWITAKHGGNSTVFGLPHIPHCAALKGSHSADISNVTLQLFKGTSNEVEETITSVTLQPGKCFGRNVFMPMAAMTVVDTCVYTDYESWALFHECGTLDANGVEDEFALVLYKEGKISKSDLQGRIDSLIQDNKKVWPEKFVQMVKDTEWVDENMCRDEALGYCRAQFDAEQLRTGN